MQRRSIRWSLPLSFAGIALLATLLLGSLMLIVLSQYYSEQEKQFLESNATNLKSVVVQIINSDQPQLEKEQMVTSLAFITEVQIRVLDEHYMVLYDSGVPSATTMVNFVTTTYGTAEGADVTINRVESPANAAQGTAIPAQPITGPELNPLDQIVVGQFSSTVIAPIDKTPDQGATVMNLPISMVIVRDYGLGYNFDSITDSRSNLFVISDLDGSGKQLELSNGPAYGQEVIRSVIIAWAIAGFLAVILSAVAGWYSSRQVVSPVMGLLRATKLMQQGNLSSRVDLPEAQSTTEFGELASSFNSMADQIEQNMKTLQNFVADAAHEINTPLTALKTNLEMLQNDSKPEYLHKAIEQCERLYALADELLDLSRIEAAGSQAVCEQVDLSKLLAGIAEIYASRCDQKNIQFSCHIMNEPVFLNGDENLLRRAICNILDNSIKFTPEGGSITLSTSVRDSDITVAVTDTGIGIPADDLPELFDRFHRGRNSWNFPGNGLGLVIARACLASCSGRIAVSSEEGRGTEVEISFRHEV